MKHSDNITSVANLPIDYMGFIFYDKSKRFVGENNLAIQQFNNSTIDKVGVFVNASQEYILTQVKQYNLSAIQLHGDESSAFCEQLKAKSDALKVTKNSHSSLVTKNLEVIKVFQVDDHFDFNTLKAYKPYVDYFLFDTKSSQYGGTGKQFDWTILKDYDNEVPFILSGGIGPDAAEAIANNKELQHLNIHAIDINSCFETEPAVKNIEALKTFITTVKHAIHS